MSGAPSLTLPEFEGPLELLLALIERGRLPITRVSLANVADQYLAAVRALPEPDPELLARFLVVAGKLLLIKSRALLPGPPTSAEPDPAEELEQRLIEYRAIAEVARQLGELEARSWRSYPPPPRPLPELLATQPGSLEPGELLAALQALGRPAPQPAPELRLPVRARVEERLALLEAELRSTARVDLARVAGRTVDEVIATLLAVLELFRRGQVLVEQRVAFGRVWILRAGGERPTAVPGAIEA